MFEVDEKIGSKYRLIVLINQRSKQLMQGAIPRVDADTDKAVPIAMQEILEGKVRWKTKEVKPPVPVDSMGELVLDQIV